MQKAIREVLLAEFDSPLRTLDAFEEAASAENRLLPVSSLPHGVDGVAFPEAGTLESVCGGRGSIRFDGEVIKLDVDDKSISMPSKCAPVLSHVLESNGPIRIEQIRASYATSLGNDEMDHLLKSLVALGLVKVVR